MTSTKEKIIQLLSEEKNLKAKQLHLKLQRNFGVTSSYQATHKFLKQLNQENVLSKNENSKYNISQQYIEKTKNNIEKLIEHLEKEKTINFIEMNNGESVNLKFDGIQKIGWFLVDKAMKAPNPEKKSCLALWKFCYSIVGLEEKNYIGLKEDFKENKWFIRIEENNAVDKMFGETLTKYGAKEIKYGVKGCATKLSDKVIVGDFITELIYPATFRKLWEIQQRHPKKLVEFSIANHLILMKDPKITIEAIITKNKKMAEEYRKEYL